MGEQWRPVIGWGDRYEVSNSGRVRGLRVGGRGRLRKKPIILKQAETGRQNRTRLAVGLYRPGSKIKHMLVHRLVLDAFVGPCPAGCESRHLNDDPHDNRLENLCWGTKLENAADARRNGIRRTGERNGRAKLKTEQVAEIRAARGSVTQTELGKRYGVNQTTISAIQRGRLWADET